MNDELLRDSRYFVVDCGKIGVDNFPTRGDNENRYQFSLNERIK